MINTLTATEALLLFFSLTLVFAFISFANFFYGLWKKIDGKFEVQHESLGEIINNNNDFRVNIIGASASVEKKTKNKIRLATKKNIENENKILENMRSKMKLVNTTNSASIFDFKALTKIIFGGG